MSIMKYHKFRLKAGHVNYQNLYVEVILLSRMWDQIKNNLVKENNGQKM